MRRTSQAVVAAAIGVGLIASPSPHVLHGQDGAPVNRVIDKLQQDRPAIGTFTRSPSDDLDFAVIDVQYGEFDIAAVRQALAGMREGEGPPAVAPIVRIPLTARDAPRTDRRCCSSPSTCSRSCPGSSAWRGVSDDAA